MATKYLTSIGVKPLPEEGVIEALRRHAEQYNWRSATLRRHVDALRDHLQADAEDGFNDLERMNNWLVKFGMEPQPSKTKAVDALSVVHINIYDLVGGHLDKRFATLQQLRKYTTKDLIFPREKAKAEGLRCFLRNFSSVRSRATVAG